MPPQARHSHPATTLLLDACVALNLAATGRSTDILATLAPRFAVARQAAEETLYIETTTAGMATQEVRRRWSPSPMGRRGPPPNTRAGAGRDPAVRHPRRRDRRRRSS